MSALDFRSRSESNLGKPKEGSNNKSLDKLSLSPPSRYLQSGLFSQQKLNPSYLSNAIRPDFCKNIKICSHSQEQSNKRTKELWQKAPIPFTTAQKEIARSLFSTASPITINRGPKKESSDQLTNNVREDSIKNKSQECVGGYLSSSSDSSLTSSPDLMSSSWESLSSSTPRDLMSSSHESLCPSAGDGSKGGDLMVASPESLCSSPPSPPNRADFMLSSRESLHSSLGGYPSEGGDLIVGSRESLWSSADRTKGGGLMVDSRESLCSSGEVVYSSPDSITASSDESSFSSSPTPNPAQLGKSTVIVKEFDRFYEQHFMFNPEY